MSKANRTLARLDQMTTRGSKEIVCAAETTTLWPRFEKVRRALIAAFDENKPKSVDRQLNTFSWSGYDSGIHDHRGRVTGEINGIRLDAKVEGTTVDSQSELIVRNGELVMTHSKKQRLDISSRFVSQDGKTGCVEIYLENGQPKRQAYWLECIGGQMRLEQVVDENGCVYDAETLTTKLDWGVERVIIPGSNYFPEKYHANQEN